MPSACARSKNEPFAPEAHDQRLEQRPRRIAVAEIQDLGEDIQSALGGMPRSTSARLALVTLAHFGDVVLEHALPGARGKDVQVVVKPARERDHAIEQQARIRDLERSVRHHKTCQRSCKARCGSYAATRSASSRQASSHSATSPRARATSVQPRPGRRATEDRRRARAPRRERRRIVRAARVVGRTAGIVQAPCSALGIRRQARRPLEQPRLCLGAATAACSLRHPRELRRDVLVVADRGERSMPRRAVRFHRRERVGERRMGCSGLHPKRRNAPQSAPAGGGIAAVRRRR